MAQPPYVAVPESALERRRRDKLSHGAWDLYEQYCKHRNRATGRCDPSLKRLAGEMRLSYKHVSDCKAELVNKGWIKRRGRDAVELLVGEFEKPKVVPLAQSGPADSGKIRKQFPEKSGIGVADSGKIRNQLPEKSGTHIKDEPTVVEPSAAAASSAGSADPWSLPCDETFVAEVIATGVYPEAHVRFVWGKLSRRCRLRGTQPVRKQFASWLESERETPQPTLPYMGARVSDLRTQAQPARRCDQTCALCFGTGMYYPEGFDRGVARCPGTAGEQVEAQTSPMAVNGGELSGGN